MELVFASDTTVLLDGNRCPSRATCARRGRCWRRCALGTYRGDGDRARRAGARPDGLYTSRTRVLMRDYSDEEIARYVATGDPLDKAGAYSIQHPLFAPVSALPAASRE